MGVQRKVLNLYYYTTHRDDGDVDTPHFTLYKSAGSPGETFDGEVSPRISHSPKIRLLLWSSAANTGNRVPRKMVDNLSHEALLAGGRRNMGMLNTKPISECVAPSKIHYSKPSITELEVRYVTDAAATGWAEHCYDYVDRVEKEFARVAGCEARGRHVERDRSAAFGPRCTGNWTR